MGVYYCPLLPLIGTVTLIATFYIKKVPWNMENLHACSSTIEIINEIITVLKKPPLAARHHPGEDVAPSLSLQFTVLRCCLPEQRMFRASNSSVLFHFMLLLGLTMAVVTLAFNHYLGESRKQDENVYADVFYTPQLHLTAYNVLLLLSFLSSSPCGLFEDGETVFNITGVCVASLPGPAQNALSYLTSEAFALPLLLAEV